MEPAGNGGRVQQTPDRRANSDWLSSRRLRAQHSLYPAFRYPLIQ